MQTNVRRLTEGAVAVALASVLARIIVWEMPQGGSITAASMVPIFVFALRWGAGWGALAGVAFGLLSNIGRFFVATPVQFALDYLVAFAALGLAGLFPRQPILGVPAGGAGRYLAHVVSGVVFFASYAPKGTSPLIYSILYNGAYMLPEVVISVILSILVLRALPRTQPAV